jgi:hypothetical protein
MSYCDRINCGYYYKGEDDDFSCCHYPEDDLNPAPCEYDDETETEDYEEDNTMETEKKLTVKELSEQYGALDLLTAYIMRTGGVSEEEAEEMVYLFDQDTEIHLQQILEDKMEDTVREIVYDISGEEPNDAMLEDIYALIEENDVVYYDAIYKLVDDYINR